LTLAVGHTSHHAFLPFVSVTHYNMEWITTHNPTPERWKAELATLADR